MILRMNGHGAVQYTRAMNHSTLESSLPRGFAERPALLLHKLGMQVLQRAEDPLAAIGLSPRQYVLLAILASDAPTSQLALAELCGLLPAQVVPVLDELESRGMVERTRSETDRRRSVVRVTDAGRELLVKADALGASIMDVLFGDLDPDARDQLDERFRVALARARAG
jgi:DNA-binding MarR family transcriptional regulator